jgi:hypothetical protein
VVFVLCAFLAQGHAGELRSTQTGDRKIMDNDDISIYMPEELERLESLRVREFVHTRVYDVNLLRKGEMDVDFPTLFRTVG